MVLAAVTDFSYRLLFLLHIVSIVAAFAPAVVSPLVAPRAKEDGQLRTFAGYLAANDRRVHFPALVLSGLFGLGLVFSSDDAWEFDQAWISLALLAWIALCGVVSGMILPAERKLAAGDADAEKKVALGSQIVTVLFLIMLYLMIWKPGL